MTKLNSDFVKTPSMWNSASSMHASSVFVKFIAGQQDTLLAAFPVHSREERDPFQFPANMLPMLANFATSIWSGHANGKTIFYELPEHLKACNEHNSI
ncbi:hypothetical protein F5I97DRAFT_1984012 [Phlebopus sp. FC_14]|nr:hypothetical protein F5I97DRAFT_1984012 [Phlebopus sp. FC_14]